MLFRSMHVESEQVAKQTLERAREIGLDVHRLPVWYDVDDIDGLRRLYTELPDRPDAQRRRPDKNQPHHAVHTAALMNSLWRNHDFNRRAAALVEAEPLRA